MVRKQKVSARCRARRWTPGVASHFMKSLDQVPIDTPLVCLSRVSTTTQERKGNLVNQVTSNDKALLGRPVMHMVSGVESSSIDGYRPLLMKAIRLAKATKSVLVVRWRDRLIRHSDYDGQRCTEAPTIYEYEALIDLLDGVTVATIFHPDKPSRGDQVTEGQQAKGKCGGRPKSKSGWKRDRRDALLPQVRSLRAKGLSYWQIAEATGVAKGTAYDWLRLD
jgi:DNA invertase Pin-like site-specific DNA recombinase